MGLKSSEKKTQKKKVAVVYTTTYRVLRSRVIKAGETSTSMAGKNKNKGNSSVKTPTENPNTTNLRESDTKESSKEKSGSKKEEYPNDPIEPKPPEVASEGGGVQSSFNPSLASKSSDLKDDYSRVEDTYATPISKEKQKQKESFSEEFESLTKSEKFSQFSSWKGFNNKVVRSPSIGDNINLKSDVIPDDTVDEFMFGCTNMNNSVGNIPSSSMHYGKPSFVNIVKETIE